MLSIGSAAEIHSAAEQFITATDTYSRQVALTVRALLPGQGLSSPLDLRCGTELGRFATTIEAATEHARAEARALRWAAVRIRNALGVAERNAGETIRDSARNL